jgi:YbbR domain-containing protein
VIPTLSDLRQTRLSREQVRAFSYVLRTIALGRVPGGGEQRISGRTLTTRMLIALVMSVALWYYVTDQENPVVRSQPFSLQVHFITPKGLTVREPNKTVTVTAHGLQNTVNSAQQIVPVADLSKASLSGGAVTVPIKITGGRSGVDYTVEPPSIAVQLEALVSRTVPVQFNGAAILPPTEDLIGQDFSPKAVTISGPSHLVDRVVSATVQPPSSSILAPTATTTSFPYQFTSVPILEDKLFNQVPSDGLILSSSRVTVTLQVGVLIAFKTLAVAPTIAGWPPEGYLLNSVQVTPPTVTVFGPPNVVNYLSAVPTTLIPLQGMTRSMTITTQLDIRSLGPTVSLYSRSSKGLGTSAATAKVYISISPQAVTSTFAAQVIVDNLRPGLRALTNVQWEAVTVRGTYADVKSVGSLTAHINVSGLVQGTYNLRPRVVLPPSLSHYAISPATIHIVLLPVRK